MSLFHIKTFSLSCAAGSTEPSGHKHGSLSLPESTLWHQEADHPHKHRDTQQALPRSLCFYSPGIPSQDILERPPPYTS